MRVINLSQRSAQWHAWRKEGISASEVATILNRNPYKTPWRLWAEKRGLVEPVDLSRNPNVIRGVKQEDLPRQIFEELPDEAFLHFDHQDRAKSLFETSKLGEMLLPICCESDEIPLFRASLDGITRLNIPVELKCPALSTFIDAQTLSENSKAYKLYWPQVQHQIYTTNASHGFLMLYCELDKNKGPQYLLFQIARDDVFIRDVMIPTCLEFFQMVQDGTEPPKDPARDIFVPEGDDIETWNQAAEGYLQIHAQIKSAQDLIKRLDTQKAQFSDAFVAIMDNFAHAEAAGVKVTRFQTRGAVDYPNLLAQHLPNLTETEIDLFRKADRNSLRITAKESEGTVAKREEKAKVVQLVQKSKEALKDVKTVFHF